MWAPGEEALSRQKNQCKRPEPERCLVYSRMIRKEQSPSLVRGAGGMSVGGREAVEVEAETHWLLRIGLYCQKDRQV